MRSILQEWIQKRKHATPLEFTSTIYPRLRETSAKQTQLLKEKVFEYIAANSTRLLNLSVDEIELRFRVSNELTPIRIMATSMSGNWLKVDAYREYLNQFLDATSILLDHE